MVSIKLLGCVVIACAFLLHGTGSIAVMSVDLGSEWFKVAIVKPGVPMEIALNKESRRKTPFVVSMKGNEREFGDPALAVSVKQPAKAYIYLMSLLGKKYDSKAVEIYKKRFPFYTLLKDEKRGTVLFQGEDNQKHSVEELVAMALNNSRHTAEKFADHPMKDAVFTVPAFFNQAERRALIDAANITGINVLQLMNDNTAVALNYGIFRAASFNATVKHIMFFDMGSTHTTVTIVGYGTTKVKDRGFVETVPQLVVKGVGFDTTLGGLEMDMRLRDHLVAKFKEMNTKLKKDITENPRAMAKMLKEARRVRQVLSANTDHFAQIENVFMDKDFKVKVTRAELEELCKDVFDRVAKPVKMALDASSMTTDDIESVILMGGCSRIPKVQELLLKIVKKTELGKNLNTDEAAALGAVYKAADLTAGFKVKRFLVKDLNLFPIDVHFERSSSGDEPSRIITRNLYHRLNPLPQKKVMTFNKKPKDFDFNTSYGDLTFLSPHLKSSLLLDTLTHVKLSGVEEAHQKNDKIAQKGVKAYFNLDESGLLQLEKVEAHFEKSPEQVKKEEEEESTLSKLGSKLSSFFGSGKKEGEEEGAEEKKSEETKEDKKEEKEKKEKDDGKKKDKSKKEKADEKAKETPKTKDSNNTATNKTDDKSGNKTKEVKPKKPVTIKEPINLEVKWLDVMEIDKETFDASKEKLKSLTERDLAKLATEKARNNLESHVFEFKDKLTNEEVQRLSTPEERAKIEEALNKASDWLDEEGFDADEKILKSKLKELKELSSDLRLRMKELDELPKAITAMLQSLNLSNSFIESMKNLPDAKEIYTEKDFTEIEKIHNESQEWLVTNWKKQNESDPTKKPVLLSKDVYYQQGKLDREMMYLINKAKYYVPKPKPKPKANTTSANTTKAKDANATNTEEQTSTGESKEDVEAGREETKKPDTGNQEKAKSEKDDSKKEEKKEQPKEEEKPSTKTDDKKAEKPAAKTDDKTAGKPATKTDDKEKKKDIKDDKKEGETKKPEHHIPEDEL